MSEESLMPERDEIWAKHDGLTPALAAEMLAFAGKMEMERNVWKQESVKLSEELKKADDAIEGNITTFLDLGQQRDMLADAVELLMAIIGPKDNPAWSDDDQLDHAYDAGKQALAAVKGETA